MPPLFKEYKELTPKEEMALFVSTKEQVEYMDDIRKRQRNKLINGLIRQHAGLGITRETVIKHLIDFRNFWTERTPSGKKQKWETQKTFELGRRFATWMSNDRKWAKK